MDKLGLIGEDRRNGGAEGLADLLVVALMGDRNEFSRLHARFQRRFLRRDLENASKERDREFELSLANRLPCPGKKLACTVIVGAALALDFRSFSDDSQASRVASFLDAEDQAFGKFQSDHRGASRRGFIGDFQQRRAFAPGNGQKLTQSPREFAFVPKAEGVD